ncbi:MAG: hypothetical protein QOC80_265 [Frankiaceae bacterium]|nr:hypothetical protein [Frankiaceae bacterium]
MTRVAVAGGTGLVGRHVVDVLRERGDDPVVVSRSAGVDLVTGNGAADALRGCEAVIDVSNVTTTRRAPAEAFFGAVTRTLTTAGIEAGVRHLVALSIVGIDRVPFGYYFGKRRQEELLRASELPSTVLRATQFHEFAGQLLARSPGPVAFVPRMRAQPVAAREVAAALVDLAHRAPTSAVLELAGPEVHEMPDLARRWLQAQGSRRRVVSIPVPGKARRAMANGGLLPEAPDLRGEQTFDAFLAAGPPVL